MKFSGHVQNGTRKKLLDFGSDLGFLDPGILKEDNSKSNGWIWMTFSLSV